MPDFPIDVSDAAMAAARTNLQWRLQNDPGSITPAERQSLAYQQAQQMQTTGALTPEQDAANEQLKHYRAFYNPTYGIDVGATAGMTQEQIDARYGAGAGAAVSEYYASHPTQRFQDISNAYNSQRITQTPATHAAFIRQPGYVTEDYSNRAQYDEKGNPTNGLAELEVASRGSKFTYAGLGDITTGRFLSAFEQARPAFEAMGIRIGDQTTLTGAVLEGQRYNAYFTPGVTDDRFFNNEIQKWAQQSFVEPASRYHQWALDTGVQQPVGANEYVGDLAVAFLKGGSDAGREKFAPEMISRLPGGVGPQQDAWLRARGINTGIVSYADAINFLNVNRGNYGPYSKLYGGPDYGKEAEVAAPQVNAPSIAGTELVPGVYLTGGVEKVETPSQSAFVPTPSAITSPNTETLPSNIPFLNQGQSSRLESVFQEYGHATDVTLNFVPSLFGAKFTPFADLNERTGLGAPNPILAEARAGVSAREAEYQNFYNSYDFAAGKTELEARAKANTNAQGYWIGGQQSLDVYNQQVAQFNEASKHLSELGTNAEAARTNAFATGAYVTRNGQMVENPDMLRPYGAASDWGKGASDFLTSKIGVSREQFAAYDVVAKSQPAPILENAIYGFNREVFTNPEGLVASGISGLQIAILTGGAGNIVGAVAEGGGVGSRGAATLGRIGASPVIRYGVPGLFIGQGTYQATGGFKLSPQESAMNIGAAGAHLAAMGYGGFAPEAVRGIGVGLETANPRLVYAKTETYALNYQQYPDVMVPSGVGGELRMTQTTDPYHMVFNIFGRDIGLPQALRPEPLVETTRLGNVDTVALIGNRLPGVESNPVVGSRVISIRGEIPANPFSDAGLHATGDVRIGEARLPRTFSDYFQMGAADARLHGISQEEATANIMADAARVTTPTTGYRVLDTYMPRGTSLWDAVNWNLPQNGGAPIAFNRIVMEDFVGSFEYTRTGGNLPAGRIGITRDALGGEAGSLELGGSMHPEAKIIRQLQESSRTITVRGENERAFAFDQRGNKVYEEVGGRASVSQRTARDVSNTLALGREYSYLVHTHPMDYLSDRLNISNVRTHGIYETLVGSIYEKEVLNIPSVQDLEISSRLNTPMNPHEYIVTPKGVLRMSPDARGSWYHYRDFINNINPRDTMMDAPDIARRSGIDIQFIGQTRQYSPRTSYTERLTDVSGEMQSSYPRNIREQFGVMIDRLALGNPNLEFAPEVSTPRPRGGVTVSGGGGGGGSSNYKPGIQVIRQEAITRPVTITRTARTPEPISMPETRQAFLSENIGLPRTESLAREAELGLGLFSFSGTTPALMSASRQDHGRINRVGQTQPQEFVRAFELGSDLRRVQESGQERDRVRAFIMGSDAIRVQRTRQMSEPFVLQSSRQELETLQGNRQEQQQLITPIQTPRSGQVIVDIGPGPEIPPPPPPGIIIPFGGLDFAPGGTGPFGRKRRRNFLEVFRMGLDIGGPILTPPKGYAPPKLRRSGIPGGKQKVKVTSKRKTV